MKSEARDWCRVLGELLSLLSRAPIERSGHHDMISSFKPYLPLELRKNLDFEKYIYLESPLLIAVIPVLRTQLNSVTGILHSIFRRKKIQIQE